MQITSTQINFSVTESEVLGLQVGRCNSDFFDSMALYSQIVSDRYDLCRLKVPAEDEMAAHKLNATGLPFFFSGSIRRYKTKIIEDTSGMYNYPDLVYEIYDGSQDKLLKDMIAGTWGIYPIGYYRTPYLSSLVDKEKETECLFQFYKKFNLNSSNPDNRILFIRHGDNYVGFFALNVINNNLESHIGGILKPFRKGGYFLDKLRYIKEFCVSNRLEHFIFGARNENSEVQRIFQFAGFQPVGSENVFHIPSLLSFSLQKTIEKEITIESTKLNSWSHKLFSETAHIANTFFPSHDKISFQVNKPEELENKTSFKVVYSFPVITDEEILIVLLPQENGSKFTGYFRAWQ